MKIQLSNPSTLRYLSVLVGLMLTIDSFAVCTPVGGDAGIGVSIGQNVALGRLTSPDAGNASSTVTISSAGTRSVPSNLLINTQNQASFGDVYNAAIVNVTGAADCQFRIEINNVDASRITSVSLLGVSGTSLSTNNSGAIGTLSAVGNATIHIGTSVVVNSTDIGDISENFTVDITYIP
jgi:hypothetical protein